MYVLTSDNVQSLHLANTGAVAFLAQTGAQVLDAWRNTGMSAPEVMTSITWTAPPAFASDVTGLSLSAGGTAQLTLSAGAEHAGRLYLVLGSTSGTAPGLPIDDLLLPLNPDAYFQFTLANPGGGVLTDALDFLDAGGQASAALAIPAGANPVLAGSAADHAYVVIDVPGTGALSFASNAVGTELLPEPPRPTGRAPGARQPRSRRPGRSARASCTRR